MGQHCEGCGSPVDVLTDGRGNYFCKTCVAAAHAECHSGDCTQHDHVAGECECYCLRCSGEPISDGSPSPADILQAVRETLWPDGDPDFEWSPETFDMVARLVGGPSVRGGK